MKKILSIGILFLCLFLAVPAIARSQAIYRNNDQTTTEKVYLTPPSKVLNYTHLPYNATLYAELMLPGYYTPYEYAASASGSMLSNPVPVEAYVVCDDDMFTQMQEIYWWRFWQPVTWEEVFMWDGTY